METQYTKQEIINRLHEVYDYKNPGNTESVVQWCRDVALEMLKPLNSNAFVVLPWKSTPEAIRNVCCFNGGDEDWVVITRREPEYYPSWLERTDSCHEPDCYVFDGVVIYVGSHA